MTEKQYMLLVELISLCETRSYAKPLDLGGSSGSHHSATLYQLVRAGLAERSKNYGMTWARGKDAIQGGRGACVYRSTAEGVHAIEKVRRA